METSDVKTFVESQLKDAGVSYTEAALEALLNPRYLPAEQLASLPEAEIKNGLKQAVAEAVKRYQKRAKRAKADDVKLREIDSRTVTRNLFGKVAPFTKPKPAEPEPEAEAEGTEGGESAEAES